jgi:mRNA interferase RelE/StbE
MYEINFSAVASRYFKKIRDKHLLAVFKDAIDKLKTNPYVGVQKTGDLRGIYGYDIKYMGINYELAYRVYEDEGEDGLVVVLLAGTRENFYDELKRIVI